MPQDPSPYAPAGPALHGAADLLRLLANDRRMQVLCALRRGELPVGRLAAEVGLSQSALSQHLARLRGAGAVVARRAGRTIYYRVGEADVLTLLDAVAGVLRRRAEAEA